MEQYYFNDESLKDYSIICEYWETSRARGHRAILMYKGMRIQEAKIRYYNRTREVYRFQSVMRKVVNEYKEDKLQEFIENYKSDCNITRFKKGEKENVIKSFDSCEIGERINKMLEAISFGNHGDFKRDFN